METLDFGELAARLSAGLDDVRVCLFVSADGFTLAVHPASKEERAREAWDRLQGVGDPHRGFLDLGEEVWAVVRRGAYSGLVIASAGARPGLILDKLELALRAAEEARLREGSEPVAAAKAEIPRRPRTSLHRPEEKPERVADARSEPKAKAEAKTTRRPEDKPKSKRELKRLSESVGPKYSPPETLTGAAQRVVDVTSTEQEERDPSAPGQGTPAPEPAPPAAGGPGPGEGARGRESDPDSPLVKELHELAAGADAGPSGPAAALDAGTDLVGTAPEAVTGAAPEAEVTATAPDSEVSAVSDAGIAVAPPPEPAVAPAEEMRTEAPERETSPGDEPREDEGSPGSAEASGDRPKASAGPGGDEGEIDRVALAREFGRLFAEAPPEEE